MSSVHNKMTWYILRSACGADLLMPVDALWEEQGRKCRPKSWRSAQVSRTCMGLSNPDGAL